MEIISPNTSLARPQRIPGALQKRLAAPGVGQPGAAQAAQAPGDARGLVPVRNFKYAFWAVYLFTLVLYLRPSELFPVLGDVPIAKIVAALAPIAFIFEKRGDRSKFFSATLESKMILAIAFLGFLFMPIVASPADSWNRLTDTFLKILIIFNLMIQVVNVKKRLCSILNLVVLGGLWVSYGAITNYMKGNFSPEGGRITGAVGGMFGNPNDLALALAMIWPLAFALAFLNRGIKRIFYLFCTAVIVVGVFVTFSRGGFLGVVATTAIFVWKFGRGRRLSTILITTVLLSAVLAIMPGNYGKRIATIFYTDQDETGSAQERRMLMEIAFNQAIRHPIIGLGMANFHIYSYKEKEAHNSYLEIAAELGVFGLLAYLALIFSSIRRMNRVEKATAKMADPHLRDIYHLSIGVNGALIAYVVASFFSTSEYQWYIYYGAFYAIALTKIHADAIAQQSSTIAIIPEGTKGMLFQTLKKAVPTIDQHLEKQAGVLWPSRKNRKRNHVAASQER